MPGTGWRAGLLAGSMMFYQSGAAVRRPLGTLIISILGKKKTCVHGSWRSCAVISLEPGVTRQCERGDRKRRASAQ